MSQWDFDAVAELLEAKLQNHFKPLAEDEIFISGDNSGKGYDWHVKQCASVIALCELFDIQVAGLGIHGSAPVVYMDVRPNVSKGAPKKYAAIGEITHFPIGRGKVIYYISDVDLSNWGISNEFKGIYWKLDI